MPRWFCQGENGPIFRRTGGRRSWGRAQNQCQGPLGLSPLTLSRLLPPLLPPLQPPLLPPLLPPLPVRWLRGALSRWQVPVTVAPAVAPVMLLLTWTCWRVGRRGGGWVEWALRWPCRATSAAWTECAPVGESVRCRRCLTGCAKRTPSRSKSDQWSSRQVRRSATEWAVPKQSQPPSVRRSTVLATQKWQSNQPRCATLARCA